MPVAGPLHPAKRRVGPADGGCVERQHPRFQPRGQRLLPPRIAGPAIGRQAVGQAVCLGHHVILGGIAVDQRDRAERFLVHDLRAQRHARQHGGRKEEALVANPVATAFQRAPRRHSIRDQALHRFGTAGIGHRPHLDAGFQPVAHPDRLGPLGKASDEPVIDPVLHDEPGGSDADLPGVAELVRHHRVEHCIDVDIVEHQYRSVPAQFHGGALQVLCGQLHQRLADLGGPGEAELADDRRGQQV